MHPSNKLRNLSRIAPFQRKSPGVIQGFFCPASVAILHASRLTSVLSGCSFSGAGLKFLGLKMDVDAEGWISLEVAAGNDTIPPRLGYSTVPNNAMVVGQMSDATDPPLCVFIYTVGTQFEIEVAAPTTGNGLPPMAPVFNLVLAEDMLFCRPLYPPRFECNGGRYITVH